MCSFIVLICCCVGASVITTNYVNKKNSKVVYVSEQGAPYTTLSQAYMPSGKMQPVDLTEAAEKTVHGVVHIKSTIKGRTQTYQEYPDIFEYFFGGRPRQRERTSPSAPVSVSASGRIRIRSYPDQGRLYRHQQSRCRECR